MSTGNPTQDELRRKAVVEIIYKNPDKTTLKEIIAIYPKSTLALNCGLHTSQFSFRVEDPKQFRVSEIRAIANYFQVSPDIFFKIINNSIT